MKDLGLEDRMCPLDIPPVTLRGRCSPPPPPLTDEAQRSEQLAQDPPAPKWKDGHSHPGLVTSELHDLLTTLAPPCLTAKD